MGDVVDGGAGAAVQNIRASFGDHPGYKHRFWEWFAAEDHEHEVVVRFALAYYQHVIRFRRYLAGMLTIAPTERLQATLASILADEYGVTSSDNREVGHPELYRRSCDLLV